ncbi:MAG: hypothetical protein ACFFB2_08445 [Promethearchaeota archaeon]
MKSSHSKNSLTKKERLRKFPKYFSDPDLRKTIIEHWKKIAMIKEIPEPMPETLIQQEVRSAILDILREGIEEYDEERDLIVVRHVFSAKELLQLIKERISIQIKISNVYFHLNKLKEKDHIQIVTSIKKGRQITHFYGRTARLFLWMGKLPDNSMYLNFISLFQHFNPDLTVKAIQGVFNSIVENDQKIHNRAKNWMENNIETLTNLNIDTRDVYNFLKSIDKCNPDSIEVYNHLKKLLNFPHESDYGN